MGTNKIDEAKLNPDALEGEDKELYEELRKYRLKKARKEKVAPFIIFWNKTLVEIVIRRPKNIEELKCITRINEAKSRKYGEEIIKIVKTFENKSRMRTSIEPSNLSEEEIADDGNAFITQDNYSNYLSLIVTNIEDYWAFKNIGVDIQFVKRWAEQFDYSNDDERILFLREIVRITDRYYFSQADLVDFLKHTFLLHEFFAKDGVDTILKVKFRDHQKFGSSQMDMLDLLDGILNEAYGITYRDCGASNIYCYLDDVMYSGNRALNDLQEWISEKSIHDAWIFIVYFAVHTEGLKYFSRKFSEICKKNKIRCRILPPFLELDNRKVSYSKIEILWPSMASDDPILIAYIDRLKREIAKLHQPKPILRPRGWPRNECVFSTPSARTIVEKIILKSSFEIWKSLPKKDEMRPFGFDKLTTLGFGSLIMTYRNMANNCPLAFWFDGNKFNHPWIPLLPRKVVNRNLWWL